MFDGLISYLEGPIPMECFLVVTTIMFFVEFMVFFAVKTYLWC